MSYWDQETIAKIRKGYFTAVYFNRTKEILLKEKNFKRVTMQVFQKIEGSILAGVNEVKELLKAATGYFDEENWVDKSGDIEVNSLSDGEKLSSGETVMHIKSPYVYFAHLESLYLGILARRTLVATNVRKCIEAAQGVPIIFFADRFDHFFNQEGDGLSAKVGGAQSICTQAMSKTFGSDPVGTIPHALIAVLSGDTVRSAEMFHKYYPGVNLIALVDFENDCVNTSLAVARKMGHKLWGVRLDTAADLQDKSLQKGHSDQAQRARGGILERSLDFARDDGISARNEMSGVNPNLVRNVRKALDSEGFNYVKIVVSGGFYPEKIKKFTRVKAPVDAYGVGSSLIHGENDFTADIVEVEGKKIAKAGRQYKEIRKLSSRAGSGSA